ncbi:Nuclear exosome regulator NRDE2 [Paramyrothecium foliicola]|nr:Nuclear exosome regulator NRDE2 [Paramyrothecium foliicola]
MSSQRDDDKLAVPKFSSFKPPSNLKTDVPDATSGTKSSREVKAPKFSSFKPKAPSQGGSGDTSRATEQTREPERSRHRHERQSHDGSRSREYTRDEDARKRRRHGDRDDATVVSRPRPAKQGVADLYVIDVKGDPLIRKLGASDRMPTYYRRYGSGRVLGTTGRLVIHRDGPRDQFSLRMAGEGPILSQDHGGLRSKRFRQMAQPVFLRAKGNHSVYDAQEDFLAIDDSRKRKRGQDTDSSEDERPSYRSIGSDRKPEVDDDSEEEETENSPDARDFLEESSPLKWKSIQLNRAVKEHPEDIDAWLELVRHQDVLLRAGQGLDGVPTENEAHSYAEIKLSMLESALSHASTAEDRQRLLVELMKEGVKVWNTKTAAKKWSDVELEEQASFDLWKTHLDFATSSIATFHHDNVKRMLIDRLKLLLARVATEEGFKEIIYVFLRTTCLLRDVGYTELAVAAWQSLLDLNFFRPSNVENEQWALQTFGEFWESELPRLGEAEARGWAHYAETAGSGEPPDPLGRHTSDDTIIRDAYRAWGSLERCRAQQARMPARTMDEGTDDDPFRVVIFSDIEPMLFLIPVNLLDNTAEQLIDAFLLFSGYPPAFGSSRWTEMAFHDQYIDRNGGEIRAVTLTNRDEDVEVRSPPFAREGLFIAVPPDLRLGSKAWSEAFQENAGNYTLSPETVSNVAKQLVLGAKLQRLGCYYLTLSFCLEPSGLKKSAKAVLKQYPTNAELYNAYAVAEAAGGNPDVASKVLSSAISLPMVSTDHSILPYEFRTMTDALLRKASGETGKTMLGNTWSLIELDNGKLNTALRRLCATVDESLQQEPEDARVSPMQYLKTYRALSARMVQALAEGDASCAGTCMESLTLLAYLQGDSIKEPRSTMQGDISSAMSAVHSMTEEFKRRELGHTVAHERALQFGARLLYLHASKGRPYRRIFLREQVSQFLDAFPKNQVFLSLYEWSDSSIRVVDETRKILAEKVLNTDHDNVRSRIMAIKHELARGNVHSTKAAFERAVSSEACKSNPSLWVAYIRFCCSHDRLRRGTKDLFYRALRYCPWSKEVMMEAFVMLVRELSSEELKSVYNMITSKGLRVHVDMDEFMEQRRARRPPEHRSNR